MFFTERLDLDIHTRGQIKLHQRVHRLLRRLENIEQALVGTDLKLFPRLLVHMRRTQYAVLVLHRGQWNRSRNLRAGTAGGFDNLARRLVQDAVVVRLQPNANSFFSNHVFTLLTPPGVSGRKELAAYCQPLCLCGAGTLARGLFDAACNAGRSARATRATAQFPRSFLRLRCARLRGWQSASLSPSPPV